MVLTAKSLPLKVKYIWMKLYDSLSVIRVARLGKLDVNVVFLFGISGHC